MIDAIAEEIEIKEKRGVEDKQPETEGMDEDWLIKVEKLSNRSKKILTSLETEPKSIPEISKEVNISTEDVTYLLMSLRKYGYVKDTNDINEDEYYTYALNHESVHS
jgi:predicted transcriptional regulator